MSQKVKSSLLIYPDEISPYWNDLVINAGIDILGIHPAGGVSACDSLTEAIDILNNPQKQALLNELAEKGVDIEYEMHAMSWLLPRELFNKYPDWFRMNENGERTRKLNCCVSNKDALSYISERSALLAETFVPSSGRYHLWHDDGAKVKCHCKECSSLSSSDEAMLICNAIIKGIRKVNPEARQCYLAYYSTLPAPGKVEPEPGVFLEYAPMDRDFDRALTDPNSLKNKKQLDFLNDLFACFGKSNSQALDYWLDNSCFSGWKKPEKKFNLNKIVLKKDAEFYHDIGFEYISGFACYLGEDYKKLHGKTNAVSEFGKIINSL